jgi:hypothetical protein
MNAIAVRSPARPGRGQGHPKPAVPAAKPAAPKSLMHKHSSRLSRLSRFINNPNVGSGAQYIQVNIKDWPRPLLNLLNLLELFLLNGLRTAGWLLRPLRPAAPYQPYIIATAHSSSATPATPSHASIHARSVLLR